MQPIVLFDGICSLCNSAVAWLIERDRKEVFRFASLQSDAAAQALAAADAPESLPDSMVLIDETGVYTRSDAALRIAKHLGMPWSLAYLGRVLPRPLRDWIYALIAKHRYRWFGKTDTCRVPSPAERARFLDADEPVRVIADPPPQPASTATPAPLSGLGSRFLIAYFLLYMFPMPLGSIPGVNVFSQLYQRIWRLIVPPIGEHVFGVDATTFPAGSGDTTFNYVQLAVFLVLALMIAGVWQWRARAVAVAARTWELFRIYCRFYLGAYLLYYGLVKVLPAQFPYPGPERLLNTIGETSPMGLLWTFIGASPGYQIFGGAGEAIGGLLLFWRRTTLLGALVSAGVLTNVVALNYFYDVPVKLFSSHLLLVAIILIAPDVPRLLSLLVLRLPTSPRVDTPVFRDPVLRRFLAVGQTCLLLFFIISPLWSGYSRVTQSGLLAPTGELHGIYQVESFSHGDNASWTRVGINDKWNLLVFKRADGSGERLRGEIDTEAETFTMKRDESESILVYRWLDDDTLELTGSLEDDELTVVLRRDEEPLLTSRGFRWVNEVPYNR
ncbi:MAG: thiol-disulfide oxidoreductase DCC family protein [Acidobacteriota bacterium]